MVFVKVYDYYKLVEIDRLNGYRDDPSWNNKVKEFRKLTNQFCSDKVAIKYSNDYALEDATLLIEGYISGNEKMGKLGGFLIGNEYNYSDYLYIDVICSNKGLGKILIDKAKDIAKSKKLKGVILSSLEHVIGYYRKHEFENRDSCSLGDNSREFERYINDIYEKHAAPIIQKYGSKLPEILNDIDEYRYFLDILSENGITPDKECKEAKCNTNGYTMTWCNEDYDTNSLSFSDDDSFDDRTINDTNSLSKYSNDDSYEDVTIDEKFLDDQILEGGNPKKCKKCKRQLTGGKGRCWKGYEPVPGKKPYSKGSCRKI